MAEDAETAKKRVDRALIQLLEIVKVKSGKFKIAKPKKF